VVVVGGGFGKDLPLQERGGFPLTAADTDGGWVYTAMCWLWLRVIGRAGVGWGGEQEGRALHLISCFLFV
jgi:hypothetical protein